MVTLIVTGALGTIPRGMVKGLEDFEIGGQVETIQTTALVGSIKILIKSSRDLRRFAITQTAVENHQLMLEWKTLKVVVVVAVIHSYSLVLGTDRNLENRMSNLEF